MTVDEGPAAVKTGSHGDCSDSDAAVMSTDQLMHRLLAAEHDAFTSQCRYMSTLSPATAGTCQHCRSATDTPASSKLCAEFQLEVFQY